MLKFISYVLVFAICPLLGKLIGVLIQFTLFRLLKFGNDKSEIKFYFIILNAIIVIASLWFATLIFNLFNYEISKKLFWVVTIGNLLIEFKQMVHGKYPNLRAYSIAGVIIGTIFGYYMFLNSI
jgi:hypothetical protein